MARTPFERLTARQRDCLRLVAANHTTKEIAQKLGLSPNTVDGYLGEAKEILGASSRRDAARTFLANELVPAPLKLGGEFSRVAPHSSCLPNSSGKPSQTTGAATSEKLELPEVIVDGSDSDISFHWFRGDRAHNSLSSQQRLVWIASGSLIASAMFVAAIASIDTLARLLR